MLPRLAIFGGFDYMVSMSMKNWSFDVFCGLCIFSHLRLQTSFLWQWNMAGFCMIYVLRIWRFMAKEPPKRFTYSISFCHFAKLSTPKTQLCMNLASVPTLLSIGPFWLTSKEPIQWKQLRLWYQENSRSIWSNTKIRISQVCLLYFLKALLVLTSPELKRQCTMA